MEFLFTDRTKFNDGGSWLILSLVPLAKGSKIYSIKAQMKDETLTIQAFSKTAISFNLADHCSWRGSPYWQRSCTTRNWNSICRTNWKNMYTVYEGSHLSPCLWCWCWFMAVYQVPLTSVFFVFGNPRIALSIKRFVLVGLTTYVSNL